MTVAPPLDPAAFPITRRWIYLNTPSMGPIPQAAVDAMSVAAIDAADDASLSFDGQMERLAEVRASGARVFGVATDDVTFVANTTAGMATVVEGLDLAPGDRVVLPGAEFPSTAFPWLGLRERGVLVDVVEPDPAIGAVSVDAVSAVIAAGPPPKVVATGWVHFATGWRADLAALAAVAHESGAWFVVDAIQGLGVVPAQFAAWGVDAAAADGHKWLLGPNGAGLLYLAPSLQDRLRVIHPGWMSGPAETVYDLGPERYADARRFSGGSPNIPGFYGLGAALDLLLDVGIEDVWGYVERLVDTLVSGLRDAGAVIRSDRQPESRSAIVTFTVPGSSAADVVAAVARDGIVVGARRDAVRVGIHAFNSTDDVDALRGAVSRIMCEP